MLKKQLDPKIENIFEKALNRQFLSRSEIIKLLSLKQEQALARLYDTARQLRQRFFDNKIFLYGFIYFSTWCRNDCNFCYYRKSNGESNRYRKTEAEILAAAIGLADSGVHLIDLTMGEDPFYYQQTGFKPLVNLVKKVKDLTSLPVMVSPGVATGKALQSFSSVGADWYACYQETHNRSLFKGLRPRQDYDKRLLSKRFAVQAGMLIEEGILTGVGESLEDIALSIENMRTLGAHQVRVMSFVPQIGIPLNGRQDLVHEATVIAVLRLLFPDRLIPASLDVDGIEGLQVRLQAGANIVTSLIPPELGLAGVAQSTRGINEGYRTVQGVLPILEGLGLKVAHLQEYTEWIKMEKEKLKSNNQNRVVRWPI